MAAVFGMACVCVAGEAQTTASDRASQNAAQQQSVPQQPAAPAAPVTEQRAKLLGQTDTESGESRRNDNVQLTPLDTNVLKELNSRIGTTATIVREFTAEKSFYAAEYGNQPATPLFAPPGRFAQAVHGRLNESHLNTAFSARSFFQVGGVKPGAENQYGFDVTAPLRRGTFVSLQGGQQKIRKMVNGNVQVPLPDERTALATDPPLRAYVQRLLDFYPKELPNRTDIDPRMLNTNSKQKLDGSNAAAQIDWGVKEGQKLVLRYQWVTQQLFPFEFVAGMNPDTTTRSHQARITWIRQISAATAFSASVGFDRTGSLVIPDPSYTGPSISTGGLSGIGTAGDVPVNEADNSYRAAAQFTRKRGSHEFTAGFDLRRRHYNGYRSFAKQGTVIISRNFGNDAIANLRLGQPTIMYQGWGDTTRAYRAWVPAGYVGDRWRATSNLTVSLGLRYEPLPTPTEVYGRTPPPYACDCNNLGPQIGLAYRLGGRWGVIRTAYALQYGAILPSVYATNRYNPPFYQNFILPLPNLLNPLAGITPGASARGSVTIFSPDVVNPYAHQYNFSWEANLAPGWTLQVGYVGTRTFRLMQSLNSNRAAIGPALPAGVVPTSANVDARRPNQQYTEMYRDMSGGRSWFDAGKVTLSAPRWKRMSLDISYWLSKSLDMGQNYTDLSTFGGATSQWEFESHRDLKALSAFDQPHAFLARFAYEMPKMTNAPKWAAVAAGGWTFSGVALLKSGTPFNVQAGSDAPGFGNVDGANGDRPNILDPGILGRSVGNPDTSKTVLPKSAFRFMDSSKGDVRGNLAANAFRKGRIQNLNFRMARSFSIKGDKALRFSADSINLLNTAQFSAPGFALTDPNFGAITNTLNEGRTFRLALALSF